MSMDRCAVNSYQSRVAAALRGFQEKIDKELRPSTKTKHSRAQAKPDVPLEKDEQRALAKYLNGLGVLWCASMNGVHMSMRRAAMMKSQGMKAGVPDIMIYTPAQTSDGRYVGVAIELKRRKGGVVSDLQDTWLQNLRACGWLAFVALGADDAIGRLQKCKFVGGTRSKGKVCGTL